MKKVLRLFIATLLVVMCLSTTGIAAGDGGVGPCLATCCFGPRVGVEMNGGQEISTIEWIGLIPFVGGIARLYMAYNAFEGNTLSDIALFD